ncbi:MAG: hypothetical protein M3Q36_01160 [bacterium]|nr:hypothetical protein [bacterium]
MGDYPPLQEVPEIELKRENIAEKFRRLCIGGHLVVETAFAELDEGLKSTENFSERTSLAYTSVMAVGGQAYERLRLPEVLGVSSTTAVYRELLERGTNSALATGISSLFIGGFVYVQQKIIGRNFVKTADRFPKTYSTVNQMWPKTMNAISDAIPDANNRIGEGLGMFGLGTTPFIASAKVADPSISTEELSQIERRVTRRGSVAAAFIAGAVLGIKSGAPHLPEEVASTAVEWSDKAVDTVSNPYILAGSFAGWSVIKAGTNALRSLKSAKQ